MQNRKETLPYLAAIFSMVFWSFSFVWVKIAYLAYQPLTVVLTRLIMSSVFIVTFSLIFKKFQIPKRKDLKLFVLLTFFQPFLYFMGESFGLKFVSSTVASVIVATIPLFSPLVAWHFFREKLSWMNLTGIFVSFIGVSLVVLDASYNLSASPKGVILEFVAVFSAVAYSLVLKNLSHRYNSYSIIGYQNLIGIVMFLPFWLVFESGEFISTPFHPEAFRAIVLLAIFASSFAFIMFTYSVRHLGINSSNVFTNIIPVFVAIIAFFVLGDKLVLHQIVGIFIVIGGLFLAQLRKLRKRLQPEDTDEEAADIHIP
jgi:drug/metabolite transporter (DMT)-like permease